MTVPHIQAPTRASPRAARSRGFALQARQGRGTAADAFLGEQVDHRIAVRRVQALGGMGDGVDRADDADGERQAERQLGVVDDGARQHRRIAAGALGAALGEAVHRRHLAAGVGGRDRDHRHARVERQGLGEAGGRTAADGDQAIGVDALHHVLGRAHRLDRHMHRRFGEHAGGMRSEQADDALGERLLARGREHQRALGADQLDLVPHLLQRAGAEDDARHPHLQHEVVHRRRLRFRRSRPSAARGCETPSPGACRRRRPG